MRISDWSSDVCSSDLLHGGRRVVSRYIYVVDDDDQVRESLGFVLKMAGFQPVLFESGTKFLEEMDGLTPGCVLLDVRMPGVDGLYLLEHRRSDECILGNECVSTLRFRLSPYHSK